uniref:Uncharacterized protein n=1 Tax=viral metagenome TaxID=1070528 RepID=A0A6H1ZMC3_9ZZZZ
MPQCKACNAHIVFLKTSKGNTTPVDWSSLSVNQKKQYNDHFHFVYGGELLFDHTTMVSHFATCPEASAFRRNKTANKSKFSS